VKILFDHQAFTLQVFGGISRYFAELIKNAPQNTEIETFVPMSNNFYLKEVKPDVPSFFPSKNFKGKLPLFRKINNFKTRKVLKGGKFDIFHPGYFDPYFLKHIGRKPFVLTIHDMTHELYPDSFSQFDKTALWKKELAKKATHIISVSENTKQDILKFYDIPSNKISVVWHGFYRSLSEPISVKVLSGKFLLYVGSRNSYKNFTNFVEAYTLLKQETPDLQLVCTGGAFSEEEKEIFKTKKISGSVSQIRATDEELAWLYQNAEAFVFPSFYEGFGIPVLEAFSNNCPVILSTTGALKEVGGSAASYFNPSDVAEMKSAIKSVIEDEKLKLVMIKKGQERLKLFSWQKTAEQTAYVYKKVLENE